MQIRVNSNETAKIIADGMKKVASAAVDAANEFGKRKGVKVDDTYRIVEDDEVDMINLFEMLSMLVEGKALPKRIKYCGVVYTNVTRTGKNLLYYSDNAEQNFKEILKSRGTGETDIDMLGREFEVLEW